MQSDGAGIIDSASSEDLQRQGLGKFLAEEGAWLLGALAVTILAASFLQSRGGFLEAMAPGVALFGLHGLVGIHVVRTEYLKLASWFRIDRRVILSGAAGGAVLLAFNGIYGVALEAMGVVPPDIAAMLEHLMPRLALFLWAAVIAPIVEEMYFRGRLLDALETRIGRGWAATISSLAFAAIHGLPAFLPAYVVFAFALIALRRRTGGLAAPIFAHMINNAFALLI